jgi:hypothetical protein
MAAKNPQRRRREQSAVDLAIGILDGNPNPLDEDLSAVNPDPTNLDLPEEECRPMCSNPRCSHPGVDDCIICGQPL